MLTMNEYDFKTKAQLYIQRSLELGGPKTKSNLTSQRKTMPREIKGCTNQTWLPALQMLMERSISSREC